MYHPGSSNVDYIRISHLSNATSQVELLDRNSCVLTLLQARRCFSQEKSHHHPIQGTSFCRTYKYIEKDAISSLSLFSLLYQKASAYPLHKSLYLFSPGLVPFLLLQQHKMQFALVSVLFAVGVFAKNGYAWNFAPVILSSALLTRHCSCGFPDGPDCVSLGKGSDGLEVFRDNDGCCLLPARCGNEAGVKCRRENEGPDGLPINTKRVAHRRRAQKDYRA